MENLSALQTLLLEEGLTAVESLGIHTKRNPQFPNLIIFTYDQIKSPRAHPVTKTARGHILDESNNWAHVCRPMDRFANYGESWADNFRPNEKISFFRKEDGTLCLLWWYNGQWHVSTKGTPDASGEIQEGGTTFKELFWKIFNEQGYSTKHLVPGNTYIYELCTLWNRIVIPYEKPKLFLLSVRNNLTGTEIIPYESEGGVKESEFGSIKEAIESFKSLSGVRNEGYVAVSAGEPRVRVKIKHPEYLIIHHQISSVTGTSSLLGLVQKGEEEEFLSVFPEYRQEFEKISQAYTSLIEKLSKILKANEGAASDKEFALAIKGVPLSSVLFQARKSGKTVKEILTEMPHKKLFSYLDL